MSKNFLVSDFKGWETGSYLFLALMVEVQSAAFAINPPNWITLVGGLAGITCVNLIAQGKISNYIFGLISVVIIGYFGLVTRVYMEVLLQSFYITIDITGFYAWLRANEDDPDQVTEVKVLKGIQWSYVLFTWLLIGVAAYILLGFVSDAQQTLDAITFSVSATGILLMIKRYQLRSVFWLLGDVFSILLWFRTGMHVGGDHATLVMYCMYTLNSILGIFNRLKVRNKMEKNRQGVRWQ